MKDAGCWQISYGIESGSQKILDLYKKGINIAQIKAAVNMTKKAGLSCRGFFMLGNPLETQETIKDTEALAKNFDDIFFAFLTPLPGTAIYTDIKKYGKVTLEWSEMDRFKPNFIPRGLTQDFLIRAYRRIHLKFYLRPKVICHYIIKIIRTRDIKKILIGFGAFIQLVFRRKN